MLHLQGKRVSGLFYGKAYTGTVTGFETWQNTDRTVGGIGAVITLDSPIRSGGSVLTTILLSDWQLHESPNKHSIHLAQ